MNSNTRLDDGFRTLITLSEAPTIKLYEKEVTPPGLSAGGPIDTTTMRNIAYRTQAPRQLKSLTQVSATVAYATSVYPQILAQMGVNQLVTLTWPDNSTLAFWGWLEEFTPAANTEGEQPTANLVITPGNIDNTGAEVAPLYTPADESESESV